MIEGCQGSILESERSRAEEVRVRVWMIMFEKVKRESETYPMSFLRIRKGWVLVRR